MISIRQSAHDLSVPAVGLAEQAVNATDRQRDKPHTVMVDELPIGPPCAIHNAAPIRQKVATKAVRAQAHGVLPRWQHLVEPLAHERHFHGLFITEVMPIRYRKALVCPGEGSNRVDGGLNGARTFLTIIRIPSE